MVPEIVSVIFLVSFGSPYALRDAMNRMQLSARAYDRILRVARTIADLEGHEAIQTTDLQEAIGYRNLDRSSWGE